MKCVWYGYFTNYLESVEELRKGLVPNHSEWDINLSQEISTGYPLSTKSTVRIKHTLFWSGFSQFREMHDVFNLISYSLWTKSFNDKVGSPERIFSHSILQEIKVGNWEWFILTWVKIIKIVLKSIFCRNGAICLKQFSWTSGTVHRKPMLLVAVNCGVNGWRKLQRWCQRYQPQKVN